MCDSAPDSVRYNAKQFYQLFLEYENRRIALYMSNATLLLFEEFIFIPTDVFI